MRMQAEQQEAVKKLQSQSVAQGTASFGQSVTYAGQPLGASLGPLHVELNKVYDRSIGVMESKIYEQEGEIKALKEMIVARDQCIGQMQKELMELRNIREREKVSGEVVTDLVRNIKNNVDSGFKSVQESNGGDISKIVLEVKKELAMAFLKDFKEAKQADRESDPRFSFSSLMASKLSFGNEKPAVNATAPQTVPVGAKSPLEQASAPTMSSNDDHNTNPTPLFPNTQQTYTPYEYTSEPNRFIYTPYTIPPTKPQPSLQPSTLPSPSF